MCTHSRVKIKNIPTPYRVHVSILNSWLKLSDVDIVVSSRAACGRLIGEIVVRLNGTSRCSTKKLNHWK
jgi:hypothetical protein